MKRIGRMLAAEKTREGSGCRYCALLLLFLLIPASGCSAGERPVGTEAAISPPAASSTAPPAPTSPAPQATSSGPPRPTEAIPTNAGPPPSPTRPGPWMRLAPMAFPRSEMSAAYLGGRIYVPGGFENGDPEIIQSAAFEAYDIAAGKWLTLAPLPEARHHLMSVAYEGSIYVFGGAGPETPANNAWRYDPASDSWSTLAPMPEERIAGAAVALDGYLYVVGGQGGTAALLRYDPATDSWSSLASMRQPREHNAAVVLDGEIWALAGRWQGATGAVESYDPATDQWTERPGMNQPRSGFGATVLDGRIIVAGGEVVDGAPFALNSIEVYNPESGGWAIIPLTLPGPLHGMPIVAVDGALYVAGGSGVAAGVSNQGELFKVLLLE